MQDIIIPKRTVSRPPSRAGVYPERSVQAVRQRRVVAIDGVTTVRKQVSIVQKEVFIDTDLKQKTEPHKVSVPVQAGTDKSVAMPSGQTQPQISSATIPQATPSKVVDRKGAQEADESDTKPQKKRWLGGLRRRPSLGVVAVILLLGITTYVSVDTWMTNNQVKAELSGGAVAADTPESRQAAEGRDEEDLPTDYLANYTVSSELPRALYVNKLDIQARILPMGVNPDGSMQAPVNIFDSGWYTGSAKPGTKGAAVIDAHASGPTREGLFAYLDTLKVDDTLEIERGDGTKFTYRVVYTETVPLDQVDMKKVLLPHGNTDEGLNLITCAGSWLQSKKTFDKRTIVYTERV